MYKVIATKIKESSAKLLERICAKKGLVIYNLFQMYVDVTIRYMSDRHNLSPEMERMIDNFEHMEGWDKALNLADAEATPSVDTALYFVAEEGKKQVRGVLVEKPFFGLWTQDYNVQHILEKTICLLFPSRYRKMRRIANDMGATSLLDMFDKLIADYTHESDTASIRQEFEDCDRDDYGRRMSDHRYRQKKHFTPDTMPKQTTIKFAPEDVPELPETSQFSRPYQPFDQEY